MGMNNAKRFEIKWAGRWLAYIVAPTADAAKAKLIAERGYTYYTPESLTATEIPFPSFTDDFGNTVHR